MVKRQSSIVRTPEANRHVLRGVGLQGVLRKIRNGTVEGLATEYTFAAYQGAECNMKLMSKIS